ncbi:hypothetical protein DO303_22060 [Salmonella enterica]|nr:hypothetical protein [Salmonella enterica]
MLFCNLQAFFKNASLLCALIALVILNRRINCHLVDIWQLSAKLFFDELFSVHERTTSNINSLKFLCLQCVSPILFISSVHVCQLLPIISGLSP